MLTASLASKSARIGQLRCRGGEAERTSSQPPTALAPRQVARLSAPARNVAAMSVPKPNQNTGPLAGHVRRGRTFSSPLVATGNLLIADWIRDDLPDLLWPALTLAEQGTDTAARFVRWQGAVQQDARGLAKPSTIADGLDGRLTSLDRLVAAAPDARESISSRAREFGILSPGVARALASYPYRPAEWLTLDLGFAMTPPEEPEVDLIATAVLEAWRDGHRESVLKCLSIWSRVQAGTFSTNAQTIELLKDYPGNEAKLSQADSVVRASWGAMKGAMTLNDPVYYDESTRWAKVFWGANSMTTGCLRRQDVERRQEVSTETDDGLADEPEVGGLRPEDFQQRAMDLMSSYIEAVETSPSRLYDQEREEVHVGLVSRCAREVITALGIRDLWCSEHGSHIARTLVEARIMLAWMAGQDQATIYRSYQNYGAGKAKLYSLIAEETPLDFVIDGFSDAVDELRRLSHNDDVFDHRVVDISATFANGKSLREMAEECGLLDLYRHAYKIASGVSHSEWWSVELHAMERCLNVLHRGHLIASTSLSAGGAAPLARSWVISLYALIRLSLDILDTPASAIDEAFGWLTEAVDEDDAHASDDSDPTRA